jgi:hypothetical protein
VSDKTLDGLLLPPGKAITHPQSCAPGEQQKPGVGGRRVPLLDGSSHDLDAGNGAVNCSFRTTAATTMP